MSNNWIQPPTEEGWYWWRESEKFLPIPVLVKKGPFGNDAFKPGAGWVSKKRMGGQWWPERIQEPES